MKDWKKHHLKEILEKKQKGRCYICGEKPKHKSLQLHHIKPKRYGGEDDLNNLVLLCDSCHKLVHNEIDQEINNNMPYAFFKAILVRTKETYSLFKEHGIQIETFKKSKKHNKKERMRR